LHKNSFHSPYYLQFFHKKFLLLRKKQKKQPPHFVAVADLFEITSMR